MENLNHPQLHLKSESLEKPHLPLGKHVEHHKTNTTLVTLVDPGKEILNPKDVVKLSLQYDFW